MCSVIRGEVMWVPLYIQKEHYLIYTQLVQIDFWSLTAKPLVCLKMDYLKSKKPNSGEVTTMLLWIIGDFPWINACHTHWPRSYLNVFHFFLLACWKRLPSTKWKILRSIEYAGLFILASSISDLGPKCDKSRTFSDQILKSDLIILIWKVRILSHLSPNLANMTGIYF